MRKQESFDGNSDHPSGSYTGLSRAASHGLQVVARSPIRRLDLRRRWQLRRTFTSTIMPSVLRVSVAMVIVMAASAVSAVVAQSTAETGQPATDQRAPGDIANEPEAAFTYYNRRIPRAPR
jgi:hypothetical protein